MIDKMKTSREESILRQQVRERCLGKGEINILSIREAAVLFYMTEEQFLNYMMRLGVINLGYSQCQESLEDSWFLNEEMKPHKGKLNEGDVYITSTGFKEIFSLLINNNLIYGVELVPEPFKPVRSDDK
ncbi:hypothetical protein AHMF7605_06850 [Adhaeribacter arboris]|uniref:Uncharacterized protein n=2 Tax=Adhaeribacter arboris TaxID=2072846 RepID=A0A2T2YCU6_9BACT|nr:hypothetical protein AHMF7605_06850 [Adhaeribacter arboris]